MKVGIITISDRASKGEYEDISGKEIENILLKSFEDVEIKRLIVPDEEKDIVQSFESLIDSNFILTTGGTGLSTRDITPDVTQKFCNKEVPGISEILRLESYKETPNAMISRGYSGIKDKTVIVNFPGSVKAVKLCTKVILPIMKHAIKMIENESH